MHTTRGSRRAILLAIAAVALLIGTVPSAHAAVGASLTKFSHQGNAFGTTVTLAKAVVSGQSAPVYVGCTTRDGISKANTSAGVNLAPVVKTGTVSSTATTSAGPGQTRTTATTESIDLLSGTVQASAVNAVSTTTEVDGHVESSGEGTTLLNLVVAGKKISATPAPNTRIALGGLGHVVLNEQRKKVGTSSAALTVTAVHVYVTTTNTLGIAPGTEIVVSRAVSGLTGPVAAVVGGRAYGSSVEAGTLVRSGPSFLAVMPCLGTDGAVRANVGAQTSIPGVVNSGTIENAVRGTVASTAATSETTSTIQQLNVLDGLIRASAVTARANAAVNAGVRTAGDAGSEFVSLRVLGHPEISANPAPNTRVELAGLGTLHLHRVVRTSTGVEVRMVELVVTQRNVYGLPVGANIRVGVAAATVV